MSRTRRLSLGALGAALLTTAAAQAADNVVVYPAIGAAPRLAAVKATSGLKVLLPEIMRVPDLTDGRRNFHFRASSRDGGYALTLINGACAKSAPCRRIVSFSADATADDPAGNTPLAKGRQGDFSAGSCTGGGCTAPSITWIERGARYALYAYVGKHKLAGFANQAIRGGPR